MATITLELEEEILEAAERVAKDRVTTVDALVKELLLSVARDDAERRAAAAARFVETANRLARDFGPRTWTREELHER